MNKVLLFIIISLGIIGIASVITSSNLKIEWYTEEWTFIENIGDTDNGLFIDDDGELNIFPAYNLTEGDEVSIERGERKQNDQKYLFGFGLFGIIMSIIFFFSLFLVKDGWWNTE